MHESFLQMSFQLFHATLSQGPCIFEINDKKYREMWRKQAAGCKPAEHF